MKTISELNKKWWYRLLKVIFIIFVIVCTFISVLIILEDSGPHEVSDYRINCVATYTNHATFFAQEVGVYLFAPFGGTIYSSLSDSERKLFKDKCDISEDEANYATQQAVTYIKEQDTLGATQQEIQEGVDSQYRPYTITKAQRTEGSFRTVFGFSVIAIAVIFLIAEIVRRTFYYIVLGSIRPKKKVRID